MSPMESGYAPAGRPAPEPAFPPGGPPGFRVGPLTWLRQNLFNTWYNSLLTLLGGWLIVELLPPVVTWALYDARWVVITDNFTLFMVGTFPRTELWRVWAALFLVLGVVLLTLLVRGRPGSYRVQFPLVLILLPLVLLLLKGLPGSALLPPVSTNDWGGLMLTLLLAFVAITVSFPFGVLFALGRVSRLPVIRYFSILYIELIRGVPLVTILFMAQVMLPLFFPEELRMDRVLRAMLGLIIFTAAYVAETVRGGLQSVLHGQVEAARALGLNGFQVTVLIVLPQALRAVIPATVGQFISLFKDTSLVYIVGLVELVGIAQSVLSNPRYLGLHAEVYSFVALVFWLFCFGMSQASRRLEKILGVGER